MKYEALHGTEKYTKARLWKKRWYRVMSFLAAVVVFCTTYALILPAVTASSKPLKGDDAYVTNFSVTEITDGTTPFDGNDNAGNDSDVKNGIVRTFDTVTYTINVAYAAYDGSAFTDARVWLEFVLPLDKSQAEFNLAAMPWLENHNLTTETRDGTTRQVLTGYKHLFTNDNKDVVPGNFSNVVTVNIKMMKNRDTIAPIFSAAMEYNNLDEACQNHHQVEKKTVTADTITVSAAPKYNVQLKRAFATQANQTFNFSNSSEQLINLDNALNTDAGQRTGRICTLGVTLQLYNDTKEKQLRGIEIPEGDITFDIKLSSKFVPIYSTGDNTTVNGTERDVTDDYTPLVWSYGPQNVGQNPDRKTDMTGYDYAYGNAAPFNIRHTGNSDNSCYNGGTWTAEQNGSTVTFTVRDYEFNGVFPCTDAGNTAASTTYYNKQSGVENIGCFSAAELYIVQPYTNNSGTLVLTDFSTSGSHTQNLGTGECIDGKFIMTVKDVNLQAKSSNQALDAAENSNSNQGGTNANAKNDDKLVFTDLDFKRPGSYQQRLLYSNRKACNMLDIFGVSEGETGTCAKNGDDWAVIGTEFRLTFGGYVNTEGEDDNKMCAGKWLLKFDPKAIELEEGTDTLGQVSRNYLYKFLYAVKPDGTGWENDAELKETTMLQLKYYSSIAEAKAQGEIVGILVEAAPKTTIDAISSGSLLPYFSQNAKVKNDAELAGKRFIITEESMIWTVEDFKNANQTITSLLYNDPSDPTATIELPESTYHSNSNYLNGDGTYDMHGSGYTEGDTLLVLSCKATIFKNVEQKLPDNTEKISYDLDAGQRVIDFVLKPKVETGMTISEGGQTATVTVTIEDTLPRYLSYQSGSCYFGGTYQQTSVNGGTQGKITDGEPREPEVGKDADGNETLKWTITDAPVGQNMDVIHYSVNVVTTGDAANDVPVGTTNLTNTAKISVNGSEQPQSVAYGNVSEKGIQLIRGSASAYGKYSKNGVVEPDGEINYVVFYANNSETTISNIVLLDTMPYNGVLYNDDFTGDYSVTSWKLDSSKCMPSNFRLYYTIDPVYAGKTFIADGASGDGITKLEIEGWDSVAINSDGTLENESAIIGKMPVAWALIGNLDAQQGAYVDLKIKLNPGENVGKNNVYHNTFSNSVNQTVTTTSEHSVVRTLEGLTWKDHNADGVQDSDETKLSGVKVSLLKLREGTKLTTEINKEDVWFNFNINNMVGNINAEQLQKIRIVASGIPVGQNPQLYYATSSAGHQENNSKKLTSTTVEETEYVYDCSLFNNWTGKVYGLRWDPFQMRNQSFTLKSITFDLADGTSKVFDFTVKEAHTTYLNLIGLKFAGYGDPNNEADYSKYCYPGTSKQVSVETGKQISVLAEGEATTYKSGCYKFNYLPAGIFAVKFEDGTTQKISDYIASPANRDGVNDALDSDGIATYSSDRSQLLKTVITGIKMPKAADMNVAFYESKYHDSGFYERGYELPKSGGAGAEIYTVGGFLMFTSAAFVLLNKQKRRRKS